MQRFMESRVRDIDLSCTVSLDINAERVKQIIKVIFKIS